MEQKRSMDILAPFGPKIAQTNLPKNLIDKVNIFIDEVINNEEMSKKYDHGKALAGQVSQEIFLPENIVSGELEKFLFDATKAYIKAVTKKTITKFQISKVWVVRQFQSEYNPVHWHSEHISGVGYLKLPTSFGEASQKNKKKNPNGAITFIHGSRQFLSGSLFSKVPEVGNFFIFPNYMMHTVYPFKGNEERRSVSFNAFVDDDIYNAYRNKIENEI